MTDRRISPRRLFGSPFAFALAAFLASACGAVAGAGDGDQSGIGQGDASAGASGGTGVGGASGSASSGSGGNAAEAPSDAGDARPALPKCEDEDPCTTVGELCENACALPCQCGPSATGPIVSCLKPRTGELCDPAVHPTDPVFGTCYYPRHDNLGDGGIHHEYNKAACQCGAELSDPYWYCDDDFGEICPGKSPVTGDSCPEIPEGFGCSYANVFPDSGAGTICRCLPNLSDSGKLWQCQRSG